MSTNHEKPAEIPVAFGRTPWDFAAEAIRSRTALFIVSCLFLLVPLGVHYLAEPATEINLFGLIKYKKSAPIPPEKPPVPLPIGPVPESYVLPQKAHIRHGQTTAILDGSINITPGYADDIATCILSGANIKKLKAAARSFDGFALQLHSEEGPGGAIIVMSGWKHGCVYEVLYLERAFEISLQEVAFKEFVLSAREIPSATLDLRPFTSK